MSRSRSSGRSPTAATARTGLRILLDGSCVVVYIDDRVALSCRAYGASDGSIGLFVSEGAATFSGFALREPS